MDAPRRLVSIDAGIETGFASFAYGQFAGAVTVPDNKLDESLERIKLHFPDKVIIERCIAGPSPNGRRLGAVMAKLEMAFPDAEMYLSGHWKPVAAGWPIPPGATQTRHERDCLRMGLWWLKFHT